MNQESLVTTPCVSCGGQTFTTVCTANEVAAHFQYLRHFHRRRLQSGPDEAFADRATFTQDYSTDIVACKYCRLILRTPRPSPQAITAAYQHDHYGHERLTTLFAAQLQFYRAKAQVLRRWLPQDREVRVLEIGSFVGGFLAAGQEQGWQMLGIDPGAEVGAFCREKGLPVFCGTAHELSLPPQSIDGVTIWNTFDQLPDPRVTLVTVCQLLRPGGVLVVRVPNGECFRWAVKQLRTLPWPWAGWLRAMLAWNNLLAFPYLYGYSVHTLDRLLRDYGFMRRATQYDMLMPLADQHTKAWATIEERFLKRVCSLAASIEKLHLSPYAQTIPWLDIYYQRVSASEPLRLSRIETSSSEPTPNWQVARRAIENRNL
jgi:SAM-dependent methyltransferase